MTANRMIVSQPAAVISELLPADQRIKEVGDDQQRDDQSKDVGSAHVCYQRSWGKRNSHIRSIPSSMSSSKPNMMIPRAMATTSMSTTIRQRPSRSHNEFAARHNDFVTVTRRHTGYPNRRDFLSPR